MDRLQSMRVFQAVVDEGGFAAAARKLDLAPAVVTRLVVDLEQHLGVRLLQRTTRRLSLTPAGEAYLARLRAILGDIDEARSVVQAHSKEMSGTVRILAPPVLATHLVAPAIADFQRLHPDIIVDIHVEDSADPAIEDYDVTLLNGAVPLGSGTIVRTVIESQAILCASPDYLQRFGVPRTADELPQHRFLRLRVAGVRLRPMTLIDPTDGDRELQVELPAVITANHTDTLLRATLDGAGISSQPLDMLVPLLRSGQLQRVLAPWITNRLSVVAALPSRKFMPARTRAVLDHLIESTREAISGLRIGSLRQPEG